MKKSTFSESQIIRDHKEVEGGRSVDEVARELGVAKAIFYNWRHKYAGMVSSALQRLKELEQENVLHRGGPCPTLRLSGCTLTWR